MHPCPTSVLVFFPSFSFSFNYSPSHLYCPLSGLSVCWVLWERGLWEVPASGCGDVQRQRAAQRVKVSWQDNRIVCSQQVMCNSSVCGICQRRHWSKCSLLWSTAAYRQTALFISSYSVTNSITLSLATYAKIHCPHLVPTALSPPVLQLSKLDWLHCPNFIVPTYVNDSPQQAQCHFRRYVVAYI